ncbi:MAG: 6-carboxyhexanoate--CoA ligase [Negativicutes bacterium]|nr:6-carboxyhexanoate--CoA ligase [Negativicutes bacterium]
MVARALSHSRGQADFINIQIEPINAADIRHTPLLSVSRLEVDDCHAGRRAALARLCGWGVAETAAASGLAALLSLADSMRGAMLICARSGKRLDDTGERGIRVSRMDAAHPAQYEAILRQQGLLNTHAREAMLLAAKVASAPGIAAELCWSDDPEYAAGYVASRSGYVRISQLKPFGCPVGGRVFFVEPGTDLNQLTEYLQYRPVLITVPAAGGEC